MLSVSGCCFYYFRTTLRSVYRDRYNSIVRHGRCEESHCGLRIFYPVNFAFYDYCLPEIVHIAGCFCNLRIRFLFYDLAYNRKGTAFRFFLFLCRRILLHCILRKRNNPSVCAITWLPHRSCPRNNRAFALLPYSHSLRLCMFW